MKKIIFDIKKTICLFCLIAIMGIGGFTSCNDYLDIDEYIDQMTSIDSVFSRKSLLEQYINGAAGYLPNEGNLWTNAPLPFQGASDENFTSWNDNRHAAIKFLLDEIVPSDTYFNNYAKYYQGIRMAHTVIQRINEVPDISDIEKRDFMGRCYYLIGYYYSLLVLQYGPVPIVPNTPFKPDDPVDVMAKERATYEECITYIQEYMTLAAQYLPLERENESLITLPTRWAAIANLSRMTLYAASPWYNGNKFYSDWTRTSDGQHFISQDGVNSKWGIAAAYSKYIIENGPFELLTSAKESDTRSLPTGITTDPNYYDWYPNGADGIDHYRSFTYIFNGELPVTLNKEIILSCKPATWDDSPLWIASPYYLGGGNGLNLTHNLTTAFYMNNGLDINDPGSGYPDNNTAHEQIGGSNQEFSGYTISNQAAKMYNNRETRFYATIGFCHGFWPGTSYTGNDGSLKNAVVTYYFNGNAGPNPSFPEDYNHTGYTCKKYIHQEDNRKGTAKTKYYPIFRYAEILLNYVEAINELETPFSMEIFNGEPVSVERDVKDIVKYFNLIRYRAGLPGITTADAADPTYIRNLIKRERQIEFACEGRRYHDLRRWGNDAMTEYNKPITGMNVKAQSNQREAFYTATILSDPLTRRTFSHKHYFWPIPKVSMDKNPKLTQNPGW